MRDLDSWRRSGERLSWRGHSLFVRTAGRARADGDAVVLVHGFPTASWDFHRVWDGLAAGHRVIALDLLGYGFSDKPRAFPYSVFAHADQVEAVLAAEGVRRCRILAHDYGDTVVQELLARGGPLRIDAVCLLNGGLFPEAHRATPTQRLLASPLGPLIARTTGERSFRRAFARVLRPATPDQLDDAWALVAANGGTHRIAHRLLGYMEERRRHRARWVGALVSARMPVRLINGSADPISGAHMVRRYRELVRDPDVVELPGVGHYPQLEAPERLPGFWPEG